MVNNILLSADVQQFIDENAQADIQLLALQAKKYTHWPFTEIVTQIAIRQKVADKLPTFCKSPQVLFPSQLAAEQSSSEQAAGYKARLLQVKTLADITGGLGVDTYFFAQKIAKVWHVEEQANLSSSAKHNFEAMGLQNTICEQAEGMEWLRQQKNNFDAIYIDPARRDTQNRKMVSLADCQPDVVAHLNFLLSKCKQLLIKTSPLLDITQCIRQLGCVEAVHVVAVQNECKEVLYMLTTAKNDNPQITAANLLKEGAEQIFRFTFAEEKLQDTLPSKPQRYIYEPNAAILKAGGFKSIVQQFSVTKLHTHTHLYTSNELLPNFPGRIFICTGVVPLDKRILTERIPGKKANITTRNFPIGVPEIYKKIGFTTGGEEYLFACKLVNDKLAVLHCQKVV